jgi:hypothetical protein
MPDDQALIETPPKTPVATLFEPDTRRRLRLHSAALRRLLELLQRSVCLLRGGEIARLQRGAELVEQLTDLTGSAAIRVMV